MAGMIIFLTWIGLVPVNLRLASRKSYAQPNYRAFALFGGPVALLFFVLAEWPEEDPDTGLLIHRYNRKAALVTAAATVVGLGLIALATPQPSPREECHRQYGYDPQRELACLTVAFLAQQHVQEEARAREWQATH